LVEELELLDEIAIFVAEVELLFLSKGGGGGG
jgi:hypothetical protein